MHRPIRAGKSWRPSPGYRAADEEGQASPFALIEDTDAWAATWGSVINGEPAYCILDQVLTGGIYGTGRCRPTPACWSRGAGIRPRSISAPMR